VLPFENLGRPEDAYFVDGMADEIRGKLAALPGLEVIARSSSIEYRRTTKRPSEIARELDVRYLLTGTVRYEPGTGEAPGRVRVSPELVEVRTTAPVTKWQQAFDAALTGVFVVQADVAGRVAEALDLALGTRERARLAERPTANVAAYDAFLRGEEATQALAAVDPALLRRAIPHYEHAVRLDSGFARAWSRLGESRAFLYINSVEREPELAAAVRAAAERSVTLAPAQPEPRAAMAAYYMFVRDDLGRAAEELTLGLSFAPNHADLLVVAGNLDLARDEPERSLARLRRAAHLDPRSARAAVSLGWTLLWLRQYAEARKESMRAVALIPGDMGALEQLAMVHLAEGDLPGARRVLSSVPPEIDRARLATYFAVAFDLWWVLDDAQQRAVLEAGPQVYEDPVWWRMAAAYIAASHGESARSRAHADSCRIAVEAALERSSNVAELHTLRGLALAYLGRREEAVREGERGVALMPRSKDAIRAAYLQHGLANILIRVGEHDRALETLEPLLSRPYYLSPGWLRIDPTFAPLRGHPRFERLAAGT
jgi:TolB-like protein/Flp pilus assembly protein TadD